MQTYGVKYIGSKASLIPKILEKIDSHLPPGETVGLRVIDVFTGTTRVAQAFRARGWHVQSSDLSWASEAYANAFLLRTPESDRIVRTWVPKLQAMMDGTHLHPRSANWITNNYCDVSGVDGGEPVRMWSKANGVKADFVREVIAKLHADGEITNHEALVLTTFLIFALDKVDNSVGVQQAYLKQWAKRTADPLRLEYIPYPQGPIGKHIVGNCLDITYEPADVAYLDPPYSSHSYSTYYHIWDSITRWDKPAVGLKTNRRIDRVSGADSFDSTMVSPWNSKRSALQAFLAICERLPVRYLLISYNDESIVPLNTLKLALKEKFGNINVTEIEYQRNIMSQIGNAVLYQEEHKTKNTEVLIWIQKSI